MRAEVSGDPAAVASVVLELARLGVEQGAPAPGCRGVVAQVELSPEGLAVAIRDGSRRTEGRVVSDAAVAAIWIDSWLRDELDGTSWLVATPAPVKLEPIAITKPAQVSATPTTTTPIAERFSVMAGYEWTYSGESANGLTVASCARVGGFCLGGRARYSREADRPVNLTAMARSDASLLATASYALAAGRMQVVPELGFGLGRRVTSRVESCSCNPGDPMDPTTGNCPIDPNVPPVPCSDPAGKTFVGDNFATATFTPRLATALRIAIPIFDHVWLDGLASISFAPFGHADPFVRPSGLMNPDGTTSEQVAIPGEPLTGLHLGVGLRIGAP
ncbi:MAG TPA: hypothetical protein VIU61_00075 [Kofleriaceae bacterium]